MILIICDGGIYLLESRVRVSIFEEELDWCAHLSALVREGVAGMHLTGSSLSSLPIDVVVSAC